MIQYPKTTKTSSLGVGASCRHKRYSKKDTINSVAACASKQGAVATFDSQKRLKKHLRIVKTATATSIATANDSTWDTAA